jgi:hypothetical protein
VGYVFSGFFAADPSLYDRAVEHWPACHARRIEKPFIGFGMSCPDWHEARTPEAVAANDAFTSEAQQRLLEWSRDHPTTNFVWINAECFGGLCDYYGFVCRGGEVIEVVDTIEDSLSKQNLLQLLGYLGVHQSDIYFEPFTRGYFGDSVW